MLKTREPARLGPAMQYLSCYAGSPGMTATQSTTLEGSCLDLGRAMRNASSSQDGPLRHSRDPPRKSINY